jgi:hypothetical protein
VTRLLWLRNPAGAIAAVRAQQRSAFEQTPTECWPRPFPDINCP